MAGIKNVFIDLKEKIKTGITVTNGDYKEVEPHIRIWNNQVDEEKEGQTYDFPKPAFFIEIIPEVEYMAEGMGTAAADIGIKIHIVCESLNASDGTMEQDLLVYDLRDKIVSLFVGFNPFSCSAMMLVSENPDYGHTNIFHYTVGFVCNYVDIEGSPYAATRGQIVAKSDGANLGLTLASGGDKYIPPFKPIIN